MRPILQSPHWTRLRIQIERLDIQPFHQCLLDNFTMFGVGNTGLRFCGTTNSPLTYTTNQNVLRLIFNSNASVAANGFRAIIEGISSSKALLCQPFSNHQIIHIFFSSSYLTLGASNQTMASSYELQE